MNGEKSFLIYILPIIQLKNRSENKHNFYEQLKKEDPFTQLKSLSKIKKHLLIIESNNFDNCIELALNKYIDNFDYKINQLIIEYPEDHLNEDGSSGSKRFPHSIKYNVDDDLCFSFVKNFSIILARTLGIPIIDYDEYIKKI